MDKSFWSYIDAMLSRSDENGSKKRQQQQSSTTATRAQSAMNYSSHGHTSSGSTLGERLHEVMKFDGDGHGDEGYYDSVSESDDKAQSEIEAELKQARESLLDDGADREGEKENDQPASNQLHDSVD